MSTVRRQCVFAVALAVGLVVPLSVIAPWLIDHGLDVPLLVDQLFETGASSFFAVDVIIAVVTLLVLAAVDDGLPTKSRGVVAVASLLGASVGLPTYLLLRERARLSGVGGAGEAPKPQPGESLSTTT